MLGFGELCFPEPEAELFDKEHGDDSITEQTSYIDNHRFIDMQKNNRTPKEQQQINICQSDPKCKACSEEDFESS